MADVHAGDVFNHKRKSGGGEHGWTMSQSAEQSAHGSQRDRQLDCLFLSL